MGWLKNLLGSLLAKLPFFQMLRPVWQPVVIKIVQEQGDELQVRLIKCVEVEGPRGIDRNIDKWQADLKLLAGKIPLPDYIKARILGYVDSHADAMQASLKVALAAKGLPAMSLAFDSLQAALIAKIQTL